MAARFEGLQDGHGTGFEELWRLFEDVGLVGPEKVKTLAPVMPQVRHMLEALHAVPTETFNTAVVRVQGKLVGHVAGIRIYRRTWMFQHLAALPVHRVGLLLNLGALEAFAQNRELEYFRIWFLAASRWPNRVFGVTARRIGNPELSQLRSCYPIQVPTGARFALGLSGVEVFEARAEDLAMVEGFFAEHEPFLLLAEDLSAATLDLAEISHAYRALGIQRQRRVVVAARAGRALGFALVELSSPGLNLYEALSTFRVFTLPSATSEAAAVRRALLNGVLPIYGSTGREVAVGIIQAHEVAVYQELGISVGEQWLCWTARQSVYRSLHDHVSQLSEAVDSRRGGSPLGLQNR